MTSALRFEGRLHRSGIPTRFGVPHSPESSARADGNSHRVHRAQTAHAMSKTLTLLELAEACGATLEGDGHRTVEGTASLDRATERDVSLFVDERFRGPFQKTAAAGVVVGPETDTEGTPAAVLRCSDPGAAIAAIGAAFCPQGGPRPAGVAPGATVDPEAILGEGVSIAAGCVVEAGARLGDGCVLHPGVVVGAGAQVGAQTCLHPNVVLYPSVQVGARCTLHAGVVIGADGFGFDPSEAGWRKVPQVSTVVIEDEVEIGANSTVDRGRLDVTRVGRGVKIDNLVMVAHGVTLGENALLCSQVGIAGSVRVGPWAILGGQVGVVDHLEIGAGAKAGGASVITKNVPPGGEVYGYPARGIKDTLKQLAQTARLPKMAETLKTMERELESRASTIEALERRLALLEARVGTEGGAPGRAAESTPGGVDA